MEEIQRAKISTTVALEVRVIPLPVTLLVTKTLGETNTGTFGEHEDMMISKNKLKTLLLTFFNSNCSLLIRDMDVMFVCFVDEDLLQD